MVRLSRCKAFLLGLSCGLVSFAGCPRQDETRRVWLVNNSGRPVTEVHICADPRDQMWGEDLLSAPLGANGIELLSPGVSEDRVWWIWPCLQDYGLMAVGVMPGSCDIYAVVTRTEEGDYTVRVLGGAQSPVSARYLLQ